MLGSVGQDDFGDALTQNLSEAGVDVSQNKRTGEQPTGTAVIYVNGDGNNSIVVIPGANGECGASYLEEHEELFEGCGCVMLQMEIPYEAVYYAVKKAGELGLEIQVIETGDDESKWEPALADAAALFPICKDVCV